MSPAKKTKKIPPSVQQIIDTVGTISRRTVNLENLSNSIGLSPTETRRAFKKSREYGVKARLNETESVAAGYKESVSVALRPQAPYINIDPFFSHELKFGATSDSHLVSTHHTGDSVKKSGPLWNFYRTCEREQVPIVFHGGNWIDGHARFNRFGVKKVGVTDQVEMFLNEYPYIPGVTTVFIAGDDHEGWWWQREGLDIAEYAALKAQKGGRDDMHFIGYLEADIAIIPGLGFKYNRYQKDERHINEIINSNRGKNFPKSSAVDLSQHEHYAIMKLLHAGGGTSYAKSVQPQKIINSYESGEKPQILLIGHYHKASVDYIRNTHVVQMGTTEEQSDFMRKKVIPADVGSYVISINQSPTGEINRFRHRFIPWLNRGPNFNLRNYTIHDGT
jgi:hypothetical protein